MDAWADQYSNDGNGGVIYPPIHFACDSLVGIALLVHLPAESGKTVSQLDQELPPCHMANKRLTVPLHR